jgi:hypothetical protein
MECSDAARVGAGPDVDETLSAEFGATPLTGRASTGIVRVDGTIGALAVNS